MNADRLMSLAEASDLIRSGTYLSVAGDESALRQLPKGNWIGGTIPYFMDAGGGCVSREQVFVSEVPCFDEPPLMRFYGPDSLHRLCRNAPERGYSLIIIPGFSDAHSSFACNASKYEDMYLKPLYGWISGLHLDDLGKTTPKVVHGQTGRFSDEMAVVMDVPLPAGRFAQIDIVNLFRQGGGERIEFRQAGFSAADCLIDGQPANLAEFLERRKIDTRLPLVADYCGAMVNVSIKGVVAEERRVDFYAPVFPGQVYQIAAPVADYVVAFRGALPKLRNAPALSCNCILNYLYSELEGKRTAGIVGPMTFGEIGYQLLNQTLVYLTIEDVEAGRDGAA